MDKLKKGKKYLVAVPITNEEQRNDTAKLFEELIGVLPAIHGNSKLTSMQIWEIEE